MESKVAKICTEKSESQLLEDLERYREKALELEAVGINVYKMVASAGWDIYPIGSHAKTELTPEADLAGLVVIE